MSTTRSKLAGVPPRTWRLAIAVSLLISAVLLVVGSFGFETARLVDVDRGGAVELGVEPVRDLGRS